MKSVNFSLKMAIQLTTFELYEILDPKERTNGAYNGGETLEDAINTDWKHPLDNASLKYRHIYQCVEPYGGSNLTHYQMPNGDVFPVYHVDEYEIKHHVKTFMFAKNFKTIEEARAACIKLQEENPKGRKRIYRVWQVRED